MAIEDYDEHNIGMTIFFVAMGILLGIAVVLSITNASRIHYEYTKDGETYEAARCYTDHGNPICVQEDGTRIIPDAWRQYYE